jgi:hypothetical protein
VGLGTDGIEVRPVEHDLQDTGLGPVEGQGLEGGIGIGHDTDAIGSSEVTPHELGPCAPVPTANQRSTAGKVEIDLGRMVVRVAGLDQRRTKSNVT